MYLYDLNTKTFSFKENTIAIPDEEYSKVYEKYSMDIINGDGYLDYNTLTKEVVYKEKYGYIYINDDKSIFISNDELVNDVRIVLNVDRASIREIHNKINRGYLYYYNNETLKSVYVPENYIFDWTTFSVIPDSMYNLWVDKDNILNSDFNEWYKSTYGAKITVNNVEYFYPIDVMTLSTLTIVKLNSIDKRQLLVKSLVNNDLIDTTVKDITDEDMDNIINKVNVFLVHYNEICNSYREQVAAANSNEALVNLLGVENMTRIINNGLEEK